MSSTAARGAQVERSYYDPAARKRYHFREVIDRTTGKVYPSFIDMAHDFECSLVEVDYALNVQPYELKGHSVDYNDGQGRAKNFSTNYRHKLPPSSKKKVLVVESGNVYSSIEECSKALGIGRHGISDVLNGRKKKYYNLTFKEVH